MLTSEKVCEGLDAGRRGEEIFNDWITTPISGTGCSVVHPTIVLLGNSVIFLWDEQRLLTQK